MPQQLYTPFMAQAGANLGNAFMQYQGNKRQSQSDAQMKELTKSAYMGDQQALAHLTAINPQVANQIQQSWRHQKMDAVSTAGAQVKAQDRQRDQTIEADQIKQEILIDASKLDTFEKFSAQVNRRTKEMESVIGPLPDVSEETYNHMREAAKAPEQVSDLDKAKTGKLKAETAALGGKGRHPQSIVKNLSTPHKQNAIEAFNLAGGGKDGVKAMNAQIELDRTTTQREDVPDLLSASFPNANAAELQQLQATVDGSKNVGAGLKAADKVRTEQRRLVKAEVYQIRVLQLLDNILANPELNDVIGSVEGTDEGFLFGKQNLSDGESTAIADINEAKNILTAGNLSIMTGVLSETDIQIIASLAGGSLDRTRGEARFIKDVTELRTRMKSVIAKPLGGGDQAKKDRLEELRAKAGR